MLAMRLLSRPLPTFLLALPRFGCSQLKLDIFASNYHLRGPTRFKRTRAVEKVLAGQLTSIEALLGRLDPLRAQVRSSTSPPQVQ
jgi:hypothetical protein